MSSEPSRRSGTPSITRRTVVSLEGIAWLVSVIALWLVGWIKGINLILLLSYLLLALWGLNWFISRRALRGLAARRVPPTQIFANREAPWHVEIGNRAHRSLNAWDLMDEGPEHSIRWPIVELTPGSGARLGACSEFSKRGSFECRPLRAVSAFPFGLVRQEVRFESAERVVVFPALGTVNLQRLRRWLMQASRPDERRHRTRRRLAQEVEFHGLRSFRPGDSPRWIHWRTSARRGELMVREFDQGTHYDLLLIVEAHQPEHGPSHLEAAISFAATIAWQWAQDGGDRVVLAIAGRECVVHATRDGRDPVGGVLKTLAEAQGIPDPDFRDLAARLDRIALPAGSALFVGSRPKNAEAIDALSNRLCRPLAFLDAVNPPDFYAPPLSAVAH